MNGNARVAPRSSSSVRSVDPSSTASQRSGGRVCRAIERRSRSTCAASLCSGEITSSRRGRGAVVSTAGERLTAPGARARASRSGRVENEQAALEQRLAELADIALDLGKWPAILAREGACGLAHRTDTLERLQHPAAGRVDAVVEPGFEVEDHGLPDEAAVDDPLRDPDARAQQRIGLRHVPHCAHAFLRCYGTATFIRETRRPGLFFFRACGSAHRRLRNAAAPIDGSRGDAPTLALAAPAD